MRWLVLAACLAFASGCSSAEPPAPGANTSFPQAPLALVESDQGKFQIEVRTAPDQPPQRGTLAVEYRVSDPASGAAAAGLDLEVTPWMPAMGHGASTRVVVTDAGDGRYVLTDVVLFMPGHWELRSTLSGSVVDHAAPAFDIP